MQNSSIKIQITATLLNSILKSLPSTLMQCYCKQWEWKTTLLVHTVELHRGSVNRNKLSTNRPDFWLQKYRRHPALRMCQTGYIIISWPGKKVPVVQVPDLEDFQTGSEIVGCYNLHRITLFYVVGGQLYRLTKCNSWNVPNDALVN